MSFNVELVHPDAKMPLKKNASDAGYDVYSVESYLLQKGESRAISTGIKCQIQSNSKFYIRVAPRSGLAVNNGINVLAGVVDSAYTGVLQIVLHNTSQAPFQVESGMRIAQLIPTLILDTTIQVVDSINKDTSRGENGFGSSGNK